MFVRADSNATLISLWSSEEVNGGWNLSWTHRPEWETILELLEFGWFNAGFATILVPWIILNHPNSFVWLVCIQNPRLVEFACIIYIYIFIYIHFIMFPTIHYIPVYLLQVLYMYIQCCWQGTALVSINRSNHGYTLTSKWFSLATLCDVMWRGTHISMGCWWWPLYPISSRAVPYSISLWIPSVT